MKIEWIFFSDCTQCLNKQYDTLNQLFLILQGKYSVWLLNTWLYLFVLYWLLDRYNEHEIEKKTNFLFVGYLANAVVNRHPIIHTNHPYLNIMENSAIGKFVAIQTGHYNDMNIHSLGVKETAPSLHIQLCWRL